MRRTPVIVALALPAVLAVGAPASAENNVCQFVITEGSAGDATTCEYTGTLAVGGLAIHLTDGEAEFTFSCGAIQIVFSTTAGGSYDTIHRRTAPEACSLSTTVKAANTVFVAVAS